MESSEEQHLIETENLCIIMNVFTVTFDQFNASLLTPNSRTILYDDKNFLD